MKRLLMIAFTAFALNATAQNKNVVSAANYLGYYEKDKVSSDLVEAKKYIDLAAENPDTKESAKTWSYKGKIYYHIANCKDAAVRNATPNAVDEAVNALKQCIKLDAKGNYPEAKSLLKDLSITSANKGVASYNAKDFAAALPAFESAISIDASAFNETDTALMYYAADAAERSKNYAKAKEYYGKLIDLKYKEGPKLYLYLADVYKNEKDDANYLATIQKGRAAYPADKYLIMEELNYFILAGKTQEALSNIDIALGKDPKNELLYYNKGVLLDNLANPKDEKGADAPKPKNYVDLMAQSEAAYKKSLEVKPDYFDALFNLGVFYFNKGVNTSNAANDIKDQKKYEEENKKADALFKQSLPYLEKADQVGSDDKATYNSLLQTLQKLYLMTEQPDKAAAIKKRLE